MNWTKKHAEYSLATGLTRSAQYLWQWLLQQSQDPYKEPDLRAFNRWVSRWRKQKGYCQKTLKTAFEQLKNWGIIVVRKTFGVWHTFRILLRSIDCLTGKKAPRKRVQNSEVISTSDPSNPESSSTPNLQQQQLNLDSHQGVSKVSPSTPSTTLDKPQADNEVVELCANQGIPYTDSSNLRPFSIYEVKRAILYYWQTGGPTDKDNPQGWLINCLRYHWWAAPIGKELPPDYSEQRLDELIAEGQKINSGSSPPGQAFNESIFSEELNPIDRLIGIVNPFQTLATQ